MIINISYQNPCFLYGYKRFFVKKNLIQKTAFSFAKSYYFSFLSFFTLNIQRDF